MLQRRFSIDEITYIGQINDAPLSEENKEIFRRELNETIILVHCGIVYATGKLIFHKGEAIPLSETLSLDEVLGISRLTQ